MNNLSKGTVIRTIVLGLALINQLLIACGKSPIDIGEEEITLLVSTIATIASAVWAWWKNNSFTKEAQVADELIKEMKGGK
jgi:SPP1 family holin